MQQILKLLREESATTAVEYAVMLALILAVIISAITSVGSANGGMWGSTKTAFDNVGFGS